MRARRAFAPSEGDVFVRGLEALAPLGRGGRGLRAAAAPARSPAALAAAPEHHQPGPGPAHADAGGVALVAVLVGPLLVTDAALDVDRAALRDVVADDLGRLAEHLHPVPLRALLL